jgi:hypothetical protein
VEITNISTKDVTYIYNDNTETLLPDTSKSYLMGAYTQPPKDISVLGAMSVKMENFRGEKYTFNDVLPINLNVLNTLPVNVTIKADNYIWDKKSSSIESFILADVERTDDLLIYTSTPKFTAYADYPVTIDWELKGNTIYVILK